MAHLANRYTDNRREREEFNLLVAAIVFHHADPEADPRSPFVCEQCGHARSLCTCTGGNRQ